MWSGSKTDTGARSKALVRTVCKRIAYELQSGRDFRFLHPIPDHRVSSSGIWVAMRKTVPMGEVIRLPEHIEGARLLVRRWTPNDLNLLALTVERNAEHSPPLDAVDSR